MTDVLDAESPSSPSTARARRRWPWLAAGAAVLVGVAAVVLVWFQPQKLLIDDEVNETIPVAQSAPGEADDNPAPDRAGSGSGATTEAAPSENPTETIVLARGEFISRDHDTSGVVRVLELTDGRRIVRLEGLDTDNGPDLFVYLTTNATDGDEGAFDDDYLDLGRLKGNKGDQNYDLPGDADLDTHGTVVIWCDRFDSAFGAADLTQG